MAEFIEREALLKEVDDLKKSPWYNDDYGFGTKQARHDGINCVVNLCIKQAPTADVVEVVRCKDCVFCKHNEDADVHKCDRRGYFTEYINPDEDYCSKGERRSDNV